MELFAWLESSALGVLVRESLWAYPTVLTCHAIGMAIVVGIMLMINLRVLGFASAIPMRSLDRLFSVAWAGFILNLISGSALFCADAVKFVHSVAFITKISCIIAGGICAWALVRSVYGPANASRRDPVITGGAKVIAVLAIVFWLTAITAGRLTAYVSWSIGGPT